jgi:rRNA pseudouridine-1189 N-methylase Emg1 (Nep1/Mra1 family)
VLATEALFVLYHAFSIVKKHEEHLLKVLQQPVVELLEAAEALILLML